MLSFHFIAALWSPAGKGLTSWLTFVIFNCGFVTFPCGILGQVWYLIVLIPHLCPLFYFYCDWERNAAMALLRLHGYRDSSEPLLFSGATSTKISCNGSSMQVFDENLFFFCVLVLYIPVSIFSVML